MIKIEEGDKLLFVIDTDQESFDFHEEMIAFCTGFTRDKEVLHSHVEELAQQFCRETDPGSEGLDREEWGLFKGLIEKRPDPDMSSWSKCPSTPYPTPGLWSNGKGRVVKGQPNPQFQYPVYNSVAVFLKGRPSDHLLAILMNRAKEYARTPVNAKKYRIIGFRMIVERTQLLEDEKWEAQK